MRPYLGILGLLVLAACATEEAEVPEAPSASMAAWEELVEAERSFARTSEEEGIRPAFLTYLAEESVLFQPEPTDGRAYYSAQDSVPGTLVWQPAFADVAASGDFGYTTGPWTFRLDSTATPVYGHYVSVWQKQPDGPWRVVLDTGISHLEPGPTTLMISSPGPSQTVGAPLLSDEARASERDRLLDADQALGESARTGSAAEVLASVADSTVRVYRDGAFPNTGVAALREAADSLRTWVPEAAAVSRSGDLGYTYGRASLVGGDTLNASYVRVWRRWEDGEWGVVLDFMLPHGTDE